MKQSTNIFMRQTDRKKERTGKERQINTAIKQCTNIFMRQTDRQKEKQKREIKTNKYSNETMHKDYFSFEQI